MGGFGPWSRCPLSRRTESRWGPCLYSNQESKPWNILGKGQIWEHPHNDPVFHWEIAFTFNDISIDFSFPHEDVQVFQSLMSPQDIFPPDFPESSIDSLLTGILQADQVTDRHRMFIVKWPFPFARLGAHLHGKFSAIWQWRNIPVTFTVGFHSHEGLKAVVLNLGLTSIMMSFREIWKISMPLHRFMCYWTSSLGIWTFKSSPRCLSSAAKAENCCSEVYSCGSHPWVHIEIWETLKTSQSSPPSLNQWFLNLSIHQNHMEVFFLKK